MRKSTLAAFWGVGAAAVAAAGTAAMLVGISATAAPASGGTASTTGGKQGPAAAQAPAPAKAGGGNGGNNGNGNGGGNSGNGAGNGSGVVTPPGKALTVVASATGTLAPGRTATLNVTVTNPNNQPVTVVAASATLDSVGTGNLVPRCDKNWLTVSSFSGSTLLAAGATTTIPLTVSFANLGNVNQDDCKNVVYSFTATATANSA